MPEPFAHLPVLDGLRTLAVVPVVLFHAFGGFPGGFIGVDLFFVISGFLITSILLRERESTGRIRLPTFWARRFRRLVPAVAVLVAVCALVASAIGAGSALAFVDAIGALDLDAELGAPLGVADRLGARRTAQRDRPPLVAGGRGAVLPGVAAGAPRHLPGRAASGRPDRDRVRADRGVGGRDGSAGPGRGVLPLRRPGARDARRSGARDLDVAADPPGGLGARRARGRRRRGVHVRGIARRTPGCTRGGSWRRPRCSPGWSPRPPCRSAGWRRSSRLRCRRSAGCPTASTSGTSR